MKAETPTAAVPPCYGPDIPAESLEIMAEMRVQEGRIRARSIAEGELLTSNKFCGVLGITKQSLQEAVQEGRLFYVEGPNGIKVYPQFLAKAGNKRRDFEYVSLALQQLHGDMKWGFFKTRYISLQGLTPVEALMKGRLNDVLKTVSDFLRS